MEIELLGSGAAIAEQVLARYDRTAGTWTVQKSGELWDAVAAAHRSGARGQHRRVAVIDGGFDMSIPALANARVQPGGEVSPAAHGSVAALLVHDVAPEADLMLFPVEVAGRLEVDLVVEALRECSRQHVDVVNISLGVGLRASSVRRKAEAANPAYDPTGLDPDDWRVMYDIPTSPLFEAAAQAASAGVTVVASTGNHDQHVYVPAAVPGVVAVGFQQTRRVVDGGLEEAAVGEPTFIQSPSHDIVIQQPQRVLGSSFASPLLAGVAALMVDTHLLPDFLRCARRSATAAGALARLEQGAPPDSQEIRTVDSLLKQALSAAPHRHYEQPVADVSECPECAFFALPAYIDFGLFALFTGNPDVAVRLLATARQLSPRNPYAAANVGVAFGYKAALARDAGDLPTAVENLELAVGHMRDAVRLRPGHAPYQARLTEFSDAIAHPAHWQMAP